MGSAILLLVSLLVSAEGVLTVQLLVGVALTVVLCESSELSLAVDWLESEGLSESRSPGELSTELAVGVDHLKRLNMVRCCLVAGSLACDRRRIASYRRRLHVGGLR